MEQLLRPIAGAVLLVGLMSSASASTVSISSQLAYNGSNDAPIFATIAPDAFTPTFVQSVIGSIPNVERSPYETNTVGANTAYSVLSPGGDPAPGSSATYNLYGATKFTILWGSPDTYNHITFYSGLLGTGSVLSTDGASGVDYIGTDTVCNPGLCNQLAWDLVSFSSTSGIGSVVLSDAGTAAFEYGLAPLPPQGPGTVPLPAAVWLFGSVVAGAAGASRLRRKRKAA